MHELSIAEAVLGIVLEHAGGRRVTQVEVKVCHLRQVVPDALGFAFELLAAGTAAEGAELVLQEVELRARCRSCGEVSEQRSFPLRCQGCGALSLEIVSGEELRVQSIEVTDEEPVLEEAR
jgi:hydrogenase nickel incorporation protein HypA/HybF